MAKRAGALPAATLEEQLDSLKGAVEALQEEKDEADNREADLRERLKDLLQRIIDARAYGDLSRLPDLDEIANVIEPAHFEARAYGGSELLYHGK